MIFKMSRLRILSGDSQEPEPVDYVGIGMVAVLHLKAVEGAH